MRLGVGHVLKWFYRLLVQRRCPLILIDVFLSLSFVAVYAPEMPIDEDKTQLASSWIEPGPPGWKPGILNTGPTGNSTSRCYNHNIHYKRFRLHCYIIAIFRLYAILSLYVDARTRRILWCWASVNPKVQYIWANSRRVVCNMFNVKKLILTI